MTKYFLFVLLALLTACGGQGSPFQQELVSEDAGTPCFGDVCAEAARIQEDRPCVANTAFHCCGSSNELLPLDDAGACDLGQVQDSPGFDAGLYCVCPSPFSCIYTPASNSYGCGNK